MKLLIKDPSDLVHVINYDSSKESMDVPLRFEIKPNAISNTTMCKESLHSQGESCYGPYCMKFAAKPDLNKLLKGKMIAKALAFVTIAQEHFDPILIDKDSLRGY